MDYAEAAWAGLVRIRAEGPLIHSITNFVSMEVAANVLLAAGASPAMVHAEEEVADFVPLAAALVVNIGTLAPPWVRAMHLAVARANELDRPWVLDPVGVGATPYRTEVAAALARCQPRVIRANTSEVLALAGAAAGPPRGVDSTHGTAEAVDAARRLALDLGCVVAVTGAVDRVTDGDRVVEVANGHPLMGRVTALGCALSALTGAFLAVERDSLIAAVAALAVFGLAGERAAAHAPGPGTLRWRIMDELHTLDAAAVRAWVRIA